MKKINNLTDLVNEELFNEKLEMNLKHMEEISKIPISTFENINPNSTGFRGNHNMGYNPCEHCLNNPKNNPFSSGFCNCALPALYNPIY